MNEWSVDIQSGECESIDCLVLLWLILTKMINDWQEVGLFTY